MATRITWQTTERERAAGLPAVLTGGLPGTTGGKRVVRFNETLNGGYICLMFDTRPELAALVAQIEADEAYRRTHHREIRLSSRGWGDYPALVWAGDITRPEGEILVEVRHLLSAGSDIDHPNQPDAELLEKIRGAKQAWANESARAAARAADEAAAEAEYKRRIKSGWCPRCESWCYGDCQAFE